MSTLTKEERFDIVVQANAASAAGNYEEAHRLTARLPLAPHLAMAAKEVMGKAFLLESGYDLSEAEAAYGKDWLDA